MPRFVHRRLLTTVVLLCQLLTVTAAHVPAAFAGAHAASTVDVSMSAGSHCADHASMGGWSESDSAALQASNHFNPSQQTHGCKAGVCKCPCANAASMAMTSASVPPVIAHPRVEERYHVPRAPECATVFFRPPI